MCRHETIIMHKEHEHLSTTFHGKTVSSGSIFLLQGSLPGSPCRSHNRAQRSHRHASKTRHHTAFHPPAPKTMTTPWPHSPSPSSPVTHAARHRLTQCAFKTLCIIKVISFVACGELLLTRKGLCRKIKKAGRERSCCLQLFPGLSISPAAAKFFLQVFGRTSLLAAVLGS